MDFLAERLIIKLDRQKLYKGNYRDGILRDFVFLLTLFHCSIIASLRCCFSILHPNAHALMLLSVGRGGEGGRGLIKPEASTNQVTKFSSNDKLQLFTEYPNSKLCPFANLLTGNSQLRLHPSPSPPTHPTPTPPPPYLALNRRGLLRCVFLTRALLKITGDNRCGIRRRNISRRRSAHLGLRPPPAGSAHKPDIWWKIRVSEGLRESR